MSLQLSLNCWVIGDKAGSVFPVKIAGTESVGTLKKAIKEENPDLLGPARTLDLWKVSVYYFDTLKSTPDPWQVNVPVDDNLPEAVGDLSLESVKPLWSVKRLSGLFEEALLADDHVQIVIRRPPNGVYRLLPYRVLKYSELSTTVLSPHPPHPPQLITLNGWVFADDPDRVFTVEIPREKSVSLLKKAIKEEKKRRLYDIDADALDLWKASSCIG